MGDEHFYDNVPPKVRHHRPPEALYANVAPKSAAAQRALPDAVVYTEVVVPRRRPELPPAAPPAPVLEPDREQAITYMEMGAHGRLKRASEPVASAFSAAALPASRPVLRATPPTTDMQVGGRVSNPLMAARRLPFYHGRSDRRTSVERLSDTSLPFSSFLVWEDDEGLTISLRLEGRIVHVPVELNDKNQFYVDDALSFSSLSALVDHFARVPLSASGRVISLLKFPVAAQRDPTL